MSASRQSSKSRICCLKPRALVFDTTFDSCTIQKDARIKENSEDYWPFEIGPRTHHADRWDLYFNEEEDTAIAVEQGQLAYGTYLVNLRLSKIGLKARFLRKTGALTNGYIIRPMGAK
ncbi:hypothetical protein F5Y10DRAFT_239559 [Nemania abortiva]|nr:hypothetical protein F5Y10DRAFT_239559 [Nemania abortiva]